MGQERLAALEMAEIAASSDPLPRRGEQVLAVLRRVVPFDSAWPALVDPRHPDHTTLVDADLAESTRAFLAGPIHARELELAGTTRPKPPQSPSDLPFPAAELQSWADCLIPAGYREGLAVALCAPGARHIGFLAVPSESAHPRDLATNGGGARGAHPGQAPDTDTNPRRRPSRAGRVVRPARREGRRGERTAAMTDREPELSGLRLEFARLAGPSGTVQERAAAILEQLGRIMTFDAGWLAVRDPEENRHVPLATVGAAAPLRDYFGRPEADEEVDLLGLNRRRPPMLASEIPGPLSEVRAWADHLLPAGFRQGLAVGLFTAGGRHVGFLSLLSADPSRPSPADCRVVAAITTVIADDLDRTRDIAATARIVESASAGIVLTRGGDVLPLPGLPDDRLLAPGSPILTVAADEVADSGAYISFLAPTLGGGSGQLIRVVALDFARPDLDHLSAAVLLCPPGDLRGLTVFDLRVLGLLVEGVTDIPALAQSLSVTAGTVADSLGRSLVALRTSDLTAATVRALRGGMRIPPSVTGAA